MKNDVDEWMRVTGYIQRTGDNLNSVYDRINTGVWADGIHYRRTSTRTLWINYTEVMRWVKTHPPVQSARFPKGSRSAKEREAAASG